MNAVARDSCVAHFEPSDVVAVAAVIIGVWLLAARSRGGRRVAVLVIGLTAWLGVVYLFFGALAPLLPASY